MYMCIYVYIYEIYVLVLTFTAEGEPLLFTRLNAGHPDVVVVDEADKVGVPGADLGVHPRAWTLTLNLNRRVDRRSLHKHKERMKDEAAAAETKSSQKYADADIRVVFGF